MALLDHQSGSICFASTFQNTSALLQTAAMTTLLIFYAKITGDTRLSIYTQNVRPGGEESE